MAIMVRESPIFYVSGPHRVPVLKGKGGRVVRKKDLEKKFWQKHALEDAVGCYVFALRSGRGIAPWYVGLSTTSLKAESFSNANVGKYNEALALGGKGTPVLFFIYYEKGPGPANAKWIGKLEDELVKECGIRNSAIINSRKNKFYKLRISGVQHFGSGKVSKSASEFNRMLRKN